MKSTFFHIGVNRTLAKRKGLQEPQVNEDGSIPFVPLPSHHDPDFDNLTYGDPWGRLTSFAPGDIAWFIESGTVNGVDWGYYIVAFLVIEQMYAKKAGKWNKRMPRTHVERIHRNVHELRSDLEYAIILGSEKSRTLFRQPYRFSKGQDPFPKMKVLLGLPLEKQATGYWFKKWFSQDKTDNLLQKI